MVNKKKIRTRGKLKLSRYFQDLKNGDVVSIFIEKSLKPGFPKRLQGRTGEVVGKKGRCYIIKVNDQAKPKDFIIQPIHLKKMEIKK